MQNFPPRPPLALLCAAAALACALVAPAQAQSAASSVVLAPSVPLTPATPELPASTDAPLGGPVVQIESFGAAVVDRLAPGSPVRFSLDGTPGATASVSLPGLAAPLVLQETGPGHYIGNHPLRAVDLSARGPIVATLQQGGRTATAQLATTLASLPAPQGTSVLGAAAPMAPVAPLRLQVTAPSESSVQIGQPMLVSGHTAPNASVQARVDAVQPPGSGRTAVARRLLQQTVQADADGNFRIDLGLARSAPGTRYDIGLRATQGEQVTPELRLAMYPRQD